MSEEAQGRSETPTYATWRGMLSRCLNERSSDYPKYGGRGITVCPRWRDFAAFLEDMGERPEGMTLDRRDNNKGYDKANCRWATNTEQKRNRSDNRRIRVGTEERTLAEWAEISGNKVVTIRARLTSKWTPKDAVFTKAGSPRGTLK